jgi:hypothetical protein
VPTRDEDTAPNPQEKLMTTTKDFAVKVGPPLSTGFAGFLDDLLVHRISWSELRKQAEAEAARRGVAPIMASPYQLKQHVRYRGRYQGWRVEMDDEGARIVMPFVKTWSNWP